MLRNFSRQIARAVLASVLTLALSVCGTGSQAMASTPTLIRSVDYTFVYPDLPDPSVWTVSTNPWGGTVNQVPVDGVGLAMYDTGESASLLYIHDMPELSGDPSNPNYGNTLTFQVRCLVPYVSDGSLSWSDHAIGWRMIVDDGNSRIELALSRSATFARTVRIQDCPAFVPVPFPWDNELENTYEIARLDNGYYRITLYNADPSLPPVTRTIAGGSLPPSSGWPHIAWGIGIQGGGGAYWMQAHAEIYGYSANETPFIHFIDGPLDPVEVNTGVSATAEFIDWDVADVHTATWDWGDGTVSAGSVSEAHGVGTVDGSHVYSTPGVYPVTITVTDNHNAAAEAVYNYVVVYEPGAGFVTGGGWIDSPAGAYLPDETVAGRANFGFVARYDKKTELPQGNTEFMFEAGDLNFRSSSYQWLVVNKNESRAQFKGTGTINGAGDYMFMLRAVDGAPDTFWIRIWEETDDSEIVIYDNGADQATGGGSITVHSKGD
jgi:PKD repeat protein